MHALARSNSKLSIPRGEVSVYGQGCRTEMEEVAVVAASDRMCPFPQNLCHFPLSSQPVKPSESAPLSTAGSTEGPQGFFTF